SASTEWHPAYCFYLRQYLTKRIGSATEMNANSALGAGGRRFESGHPDQKRRSQRLPTATKVASKTA
ncbi:MAG TPA: hypothetical protein VEC76_09690, partial [Streptosporangiaceae bacterium]|nr:hypothetical protein [Streptosporangiaceae bacterium]